jgi:ketosteroid isomerase-like protein
VAVVRARLHLRGQRAPDGGAAGDRQTIITAVLHRHGAGWLAVSAQNTEVSPGMETHLAGPDGPRPVDYR